MANNFHFKKIRFPSQIGRLPSQDGKGLDTGFYEWITNGDQEAVLAELLKWFVDDFKEETDPAEIEKLLSDWKERFSSKDFSERLGMLERLLPSHHPFHHIKNKYQQ